MCKNELEKMARMSQDEYMQQNPNYEPMFPQGWADDKNWSVITNDYESFRKHQTQIDYELDRMVGCYD